mmetsp:Transcript_33438/g.46799  ORF Transcript_33438/g.46799 Transcript_33438/m.46799 type:complete len:82 (-) Transcript_33438:113-358(-)
MQDDAEAHEDSKLERVRKAKEKAIQEERDEKKKHSNASDASFIRKMNKTIYSGKEDLQERLKKHQHYRQKGGDALSSENFL